MIPVSTRIRAVSKGYDTRIGEYQGGGKGYNTGGQGV